MATIGMILPIIMRYSCNKSGICFFSQLADLENTIQSLENGEETVESVDHSMENVRAFVYQVINISLTDSYFE